MTIRLRTVIYQNKVEIENVPIYSCEECKRTIVFPAVKNELTRFIGTLANRSERQHYSFNEMNEVAHLMCKVADKDRFKEPVERIVEERINELLDLLLLAQSVDDEHWIDDIRQRLAQITRYALVVCEVTS
jgi:hypothetical protein